MREISLARTPPTLPAPVEAGGQTPLTCSGQLSSSSLKFPELPLTHCWSFCSSLALCPTQRPGRPCWWRLQQRRHQYLSLTCVCCH